MENAQHPIFPSNGQLAKPTAGQAELLMCGPAVRLELPIRRSPFAGRSGTAGTVRFNRIGENSFTAISTCEGGVS